MVEHMTHVLNPYLGYNVSTLVAQFGLNSKEIKPKWNCLCHSTPAHPSLSVYLYRVVRPGHLKQDLTTRRAPGLVGALGDIEKAPASGLWRS